MATTLKHGKSVVRHIPVILRAGRYRETVARMTTEGIYIKMEKERWSSAYFVSWEAIYSVGAKIKADKIKKERKERRKLGYSARIEKALEQIRESANR